MSEIDIFSIQRTETPIEPWQAELVALTVGLSQSGVFNWPEWVTRFSAEIKGAPQRTTETVDQAYYRQWSACLENLLAELGHVNGTDIGRDAEHWKRSYWNTEHGSPIMFSREHPPISHDHDVEDHGHEHHVHDDDHHHHHHHHDRATITRPVTTEAAFA